MGPASGRNIWNCLHLKKRYGVLDLKLALLETPKLQFIGARLTRHDLNHEVKTAVLLLQLGNPLHQSVGEYLIDQSYSQVRTMIRPADPALNDDLSASQVSRKSQPGGLIEALGKYSFVRDLSCTGDST